MSSKDKSIMDDLQKPADSADESFAEQYPEETKLFYEQLKQSGQLIDIDESAALNELPPNVTHVRYPDGVVKRVGYS